MPMTVAIVMAALITPLQKATPIAAPMLRVHYAAKNPPNAVNAIALPANHGFIA